MTEETVQDGWDDDDIEDEIIITPPTLPTGSRHSFATFNSMSGSLFSLDDSESSGSHVLRGGTTGHSSRTLLSSRRGTHYNSSHSGNLLLQESEGWEDDEDLLLMGDDHDDHHKTPEATSPTMPQQAAKDSNQTTATNEGWEDDDDLLDSSSSSEDDNFADYGSTTASKKKQTTGDLDYKDYLPSSSPRRHSSKKKKGILKKPTPLYQQDDDDDDDDLNFHNYASSSKRPHLPTEGSESSPIDESSSSSDDEVHEKTVEKATAKSEDGWEDDFDFDDDDDEINNEPPVPPTPPSPLQLQLEQYLNQLPQMLSSINAVLQFEYNTPEKAHELLSYYQQRPGLTQYTVERELPRMEYGILLEPNQPVQTDKNIIANILMSHPDTLLSRCANQSLWADLLQAVTGPDLLVRPQFLATAVASKCRFLIDYPSRVVRAEAWMSLTIPTEQEPLVLAEVHVRVVLHVGAGDVEYSVVSIHPPQRREVQQLQSAVRILTELHPEDTITTTTPEGQDFRDVFLQQSQNLLQNSAEGLKSALQDIGTVTGIGTKIKQIPAFLPDDMIRAVDQPHSPPAARPTSILGGLVSKLAKSVALPDEDPTLYQEWKSSQPKDQPPGAIPRLYKATPPPQNLPKDPPPAGFPRLYKPESESPAVQSNAPKPSTKQPPPPPPREAEPPAEIPRLYRKSSAQKPSKPPPRPQVVQPPPSDTEQAPTNEPEPIMFSARTRERSRSISTVAATASTLEVVKDGKAPDAAVETSVVEDGWDDDAIDEDVLDAADPATDDFVYNPETDVIPTREAWVNPRPHTRRLVL